MKETINRLTGEIVENKPFQTNYCLEKVKGEVYDEDNPDAQSMTEPNQAPSIKALYDRCCRGQIVPTRTGVYDIKKPVVTMADIDEAISESLDVTESSDFDLADVTNLSDAISKDLSTQQGGADAQQSSDDASVVGKSEAQTSTNSSSMNANEKLA